MELPLFSQSSKSLLPYFKRKRIRYLSVFIAVLLLVTALLSFVEVGNNPFHPYENHVEVLPRQDRLHVAINSKMLEQVPHANSCQKISSSVDGRIAAFLTDTKELYLVRNQELTKIADDVLHFEISSSGMGVAFAQKYAQQYALTLYHVAHSTRREITASLSRLDFSLSPDGQSVAYYTLIDDQDVLMCHRRGKELTICRENSDLVGLSDDGAHIYAVCPKITGTSALYSFNHKGKGTELGSVTSISFKLNTDHRQIMFYNNGKTMVSINGQPAVNLSAYPLYLVTALNSHSASDGNSITLPVRTLFDHVYTCSDGESTGVWLIRKDPGQNEKLVSRASSCTLDANAEYLYYIHDASELCVMKVSGGGYQSHILAENVDHYVVSADRSYVYYVNDGTLYAANGKKSGRAKVISTNTESYSLAISAKDVLYYLNGTDLYTCKNGRKSTLSAQNVQSVYSAPNNVVYIIGNNEIYSAYTKQQPVKILDAE